MRHVNRIDFVYSGIGGSAAHCQCDIVDDGGQLIVVFTELTDNKGTSVTNAIESIVNKFVAMTHCDLTKTKFIERYERSTFDLDWVDFQNKSQGRVSGPFWQRLPYGPVHEQLDCALQS